MRKNGKRGTSCYEENAFSKRLVGASCHLDALCRDGVRRPHRRNAADAEALEVISNAAWKAPEGEYPPIYQASALIEICGDPVNSLRIRMEAMGLDPTKIPSWN